MTTEDRVPRELRERMTTMTIAYSDRERIAFYRGVILTMEYFAGELQTLMTATNNAKPRLTEMPQTVRR